MAENLADVKNARKRVANFSKTEKEVLIPIVDKYKKIVENKKTDGVCSKQKLQAWDKIGNEFNAKGLSPEHRPAEKLKGLWDNLKRNARKHLSSLRQETFKTGGGRNPVKDDPLANQIKGIIGNTSEPMDNSYDDDVLSVNDDDGTDKLNPSVEVIAMEVEVGNLIQISTDVNENEVIISEDEEQDKDWSHWNPRMLKMKKNPILHLTPTFQDAELSAHTSAKNPQKKEVDRLNDITLKRMSKKSFSNRRPRKSSEASNALAQAKINYIEALKKEALEKSAMEKEVLRKKLMTQDLKMELLRKQIGSH